MSLFGKAEENVYGVADVPNLWDREEGSNFGFTELPEKTVCTLQTLLGHKHAASHKLVLPRHIYKKRHVREIVAN